MALMSPSPLLLLFYQQLPGVSSVRYAASDLVYVSDLLSASFGFLRQ